MVAAAALVVVVTTTIARKIDVEKDPSLGGSSALDLGLHEFLIHGSCAGTKSFAVLQCKPVAGF